MINNKLVYLLYESSLFNQIKTSHGQIYYIDTLTQQILKNHDTPDRVKFEFDFTCTQDSQIHMRQSI